MDLWDGENIMDVLETGKVEVIDCGDLLGPIKKFKIERDYKLQLKLKTYSAPVAREPEPADNPGRIFINDKKLVLSGGNGGEGLIYGVVVEVESIDYLDEAVQTSTINHINYNTGNAAEVHYTFEWLGNFPEGSYIWPTNTITKDGERIILGEPTIRLKSTLDSSIYRLESNGFRVTIGGYSVYVARCGDRLETTSTQPGSILIIGNPDDYTRDKIRNCISFALGMPLISLGCSRYDKEQNLISIKAVNPSSFDGRAWRLFSAPSSPITYTGYNMLNPNAVSELANAVYNNYETYNFRTILWKYWHSVVAPMFMAPAYYGAIIESLQKKYESVFGIEFDSRILPKKDFKKLRAVINAATIDFPMSSECRKIFIDKLNNANQAPQKLITQRFFQALQLDMGDKELAAWARRNDAAHGNELPNGDNISLLEETRILKVMLHRTILKIINGSDSYIDYTSPYFPARVLKTSTEKQVPQ